MGPACGTLRLCTRDGRKRPGYTCPSWRARPFTLISFEATLEERVIYARQLHKEDGLLDWSRPAVGLDRWVRACTPWPSAFTLWDGRLKVLRAVPLFGWQGNAPAGTVIGLGDGVAVARGKGALHLEKVRLAGKRPMNVAAFLQGQRDFVAGRLGAAREMTNEQIANPKGRPLTANR